MVQHSSERLTPRAGALSLASCMCNGCNVLRDSHAVVSESPPASSGVSQAPAGAAAWSRCAACWRGVASLLSRPYLVLHGEVRPCARRGGAAAADRPAAPALQPGVLEDAGAHACASRCVCVTVSCRRSSSSSSSNGRAYLSCPNHCENGRAHWRRLQRSLYLYLHAIITARSWSPAARS